MITYTNTERPVRKYSPEEILGMDPKRLRKELDNLIAKEPEMMEKIEATLGYEPAWVILSTYGYFLIAVSWSKLEDPAGTAKLLKDMKVDERIQGILKD